MERIKMYRVQCYNLQSCRDSSVTKQGTFMNLEYIFI